MMRNVELFEEALTEKSVLFNLPLRFVYKINVIKPSSKSILFAFSHVRCILTTGQCFRGKIIIRKVDRFTFSPKSAIV